MTSTDQVLALCRIWAAAELAGDVSALDALAAEGFALIGPVGFVLDKDAWLHRFGPDGLSFSALDWREERVVAHGDDVVIVVGEQHQEARHAGGPADGAFRTAHTFVGRAGEWRLALLQYSILGGPPPFVPGR